MTAPTAHPPEIQVLLRPPAPVLTAGVSRALLRILRDEAARQAEDHATLVGATGDAALAS